MFFRKLLYIVHLSFAALTTRKLRSVLTIGGMSIGIGTIVFLVSLGFGLQRLIIKQITDVQSLTVLDVSTGASTLIDINDDTLDTFRQIGYVTDVSPSLSISGQIVKGESATDVAIFGVEPAYVDLENINVGWGENLTEESASNDINIVVSNTAAELLGYDDPSTFLDEDISFDILIQTEDAERNPVEQTKRVDGRVHGISEEDVVAAYIPVSALRSIGFQNYNLARVKVSTREDLDAVRSVIEGMGFQVDSVADTVGQIDQIFVIFEVVMAVFGLIAMAVASLGAFNTLTVSLLERTHEVGLMMALGTKRNFIYRLFLIESFIIGVLGGFIGVMTGVIIGGIINYATNRLATRLGGQSVDIFYTPWYFLVIIIVLILGISFVTGLYPARRASRINPLDALRYE